jgi:hypothetical protein
LPASISLSESPIIDEDGKSDFIFRLRREQRSRLRLSACAGRLLLVRAVLSCIDHCG